MGRAIDVDNRLDKMESRLSKLEGILNEISDGVSRKTHIDLVDDVKEDKVEEKEETTNNKRTAKRNNKPSRNTSISKHKAA